MRREWYEACDFAGVPRCKLYEGARHSAATEWKRRGADDRTIQAILRHADRRSIERYARLADQAISQVPGGADAKTGSKRRMISRGSWSGWWDSNPRR